MVGTKTSRQVDGQVIEGVTRLAIIHNGPSYFLTNLVIYADGMIDCWGLVDLDEFAAKVRGGWVATGIEEGARASAHHVASWKFSDVQAHVTADELIGEVRDTVDKLAGRPDSSARFRAALGAYLDEPGETRREAALAAYLEIPEHLRVYVLGDMDAKDWPAQVVAAGVGGMMPTDHVRVTEEMHANALRYFADLRAHDPTWPGPRRAVPRSMEPATPVQVTQSVYPDLSAAPPIHGLRNSYPCTLRVGGSTFGDVETAWHALSVDDDELRARIAAAPRPYEARKLADGVARRADWAEVGEAVMLRLLRAKFTQNDDLAAVLLGTGRAPIHYDDSDPHWSTRGRNWIGRLLEVVRSELRLRDSALGEELTGTA